MFPTHEILLSTFPETPFCILRLGKQSQKLKQHLKLIIPPGNVLLEDVLLPEVNSYFHVKAFLLVLISGKFLVT